MTHAEMSNAELAHRLREAVRKARAPKFALVVADRLEAAQGEPVAWQLLATSGKWSDWIRLAPPDDELDLWRPLYAAPAVAQDKEKP